MAPTLKDRILAEIHPDEVIDLAKRLVSIPSLTTEETPVAEFLDAFLRQNGLESELMETDPGRFQTIGRLRGSGRGRSLMLDGHIDIDPIPGGWKRDPWRPVVEGDRLYGAGIFNMKGGVTALVMAGVAAKRAGVSLAGDLVLACVVGELQGGVGTVHFLKKGLRADYAIVPEPYTTSNIITKHTGVVEFAVNVVGRTAHISRKHEGINAILKMGDVVRALDEVQFRHEPDPDLPGLPRLNVGSIVGGRGPACELRGPNMVPDYCTAYVDVRFPHGMTPDSIVADVRAALDRLTARDSELHYEIEIPMKPERRAIREVMMPLSVPVSHPLVQTLKANVTAIMGQAPAVGAVVPFSYAGNDTSHLYAAGIPCCLYGPGGGFTDGSADRWTSVEQIVTCTRVFGAMIADLCGNPV
ncbi:MAG: M20/M25/M40 family metallo-hydrolase [Candidatus Rokuibacteriota bacterium]